MKKLPKSKWFIFRALDIPFGQNLFRQKKKRRRARK